MLHHHDQVRRACALRGVHPDVRGCTSSPPSDRGKRPWRSSGRSRRISRRAICSTARGGRSVLRIRRRPIRSSAQEATRHESRRRGHGPGRARVARQAGAPQPPGLPKAPVEVVLSRVLSAVGYHQPPVYFVPSFTMTDATGTHTEPGGRFRLKTDALVKRGEWSWQQNPFVGTKPYQGLLVILMMFDSSDLKNVNNTLYEANVPGSEPRLWYVVRDLGTALGETGRLTPKRSDPDLFERLRFINGVNDGYVEFNYHGWHQELLRHRITPAGRAVGERSADRDQPLSNGATRFAPAAMTQP